jgi:hypothetical protein
MRTGPTLSLLILASLLPGCAAEVPVAVGAAVISGASVPVFGRTPVDMVASGVSGRDCSVVHLDRGERYCRAAEKPPETPVFCTRSLGVPDCWNDPSLLPDTPHELADGPRTLTPEQEKDRTKRWPWLW